MSTVNRNGEKTAAPSWKHAVMTCVSGLVAVGLMYGNRRLNFGLDPVELGLIVSSLTGLIGYFVSPRGMA